MVLAKHELDTALVNVTVTDGNVRLWGIVENARAGRDGRNRGKVFAGRQVARKQSGHWPNLGSADLGPVQFDWGPDGDLETSTLRGKLGRKTAGNR